MHSIFHIFPVLRRKIAFLKAKFPKVHIELANTLKTLNAPQFIKPIFLNLPHLYQYHTITKSQKIFLIILCDGMIFSLAGVPLSCLEHLSLYFAGSLVETWKPTGTQQWMQCLARKWLQFCPFSKTLWPTLKTLNAFKFKFKLYSEKVNDTAIFFQLLNHLIFFTDPLPIYTPQDVSTFFQLLFWTSVPNI